MQHTGTYKFVTLRQQQRQHIDTYTYKHKPRGQWRERKKTF